MKLRCEVEQPAFTRLAAGSYEFQFSQNIRETAF